MLSVITEPDKPKAHQHDNAPVHKARSMKTWFAKIDLEELECPAQSPDLNPTEHVWDDLEHGLHTRPPHQTSMPDLTNDLVAEWTKESLPRRAEAVIAVNTGPNP
ncbi:hypothetical protein PGIGA_G00228800 [Pangasianodon gigas]|uniref:Uncharacterized protein n=1 Tax=Pangasianodon gigas TaxID=30993 RepID=A0ACC5WMC7_PANGG|nr:hypothetical protein [Pangasianodon gigas]